MSGARSQAVWVAAAAAGLEVVTGGRLGRCAVVACPAAIRVGDERVRGLVGRISGFVMLCLAGGCWPRGFQGEDRQALAALILWVSQSSTGALRIKMHNKLAALVVLGKYLGMFDERPQNTNAVYAISDKPMTNDEWVKRYVTPL
jgi:hypothetical protein